MNNNISCQSEREDIKYNKFNGKHWFCQKVRDQEMECGCSLGLGHTNRRLLYLSWTANGTLYLPLELIGIECQANPGANEECTVAWGACNHSFHWHCISRWIKTRNTCPLDNNNWELQRLGK